MDAQQTLKDAGIASDGTTASTRLAPSRYHVFCEELCRSKWLNWYRHYSLQYRQLNPLSTAAYRGYSWHAWRLSCTYECNATCLFSTVFTCQDRPLGMNASLSLYWWQRRGGTNQNAFADIGKAIFAVVALLVLEISRYCIAS